MTNLDKILNRVLKVIQDFYDEGKITREQKDILMKNMHVTKE